MLIAEEYSRGIDWERTTVIGISESWNRLMEECQAHVANQRETLVWHQNINGLEGECWAEYIWHENAAGVSTHTFCISAIKVLT
jgi:hypothetical protein